ncbi:MAG TPA: gas vesicle protein GvpG [Methylococcus sp.]|nr:gas vesicle protein GvpG [Methylococcus sp.]
MLLVDDLITGPFRGLVWVFREVHKAAAQVLRDEYQSITAELGRLYLKLEGGEIGEEEFAIREQHLLDRMEELEEQGYGANGNQPREDDE